MATLTERSEDAPELRQRDGELIVDRSPYLLGVSRKTLGEIGVSSHAGDHREDGFASCDPERFT